VYAWPSGLGRLCTRRRVCVEREGVEVYAFVCEVCMGVCECMRMNISVRVIHSELVVELHEGVYERFGYEKHRLMCVYMSLPTFTHLCIYT